MKDAANSLKALKDLKPQSLQARLPSQEGPTTGTPRMLSSHQVRVTTNMSIQLLSIASEKAARSGHCDSAVLESASKKQCLHIHLEVRPAISELVFVARAISSPHIYSRPGAYLVLSGSMLLPSKLCQPFFSLIRGSCNALCSQSCNTLKAVSDVIINQKSIECTNSFHWIDA